MFWEKIIPDKYLVKSVVCGLEIIFSETGTLFNYCILKKSSNKLQLVEQGTFKTFEEIPPIIKKNKTPLNIVVSGSGIIVKPFSYTVNTPQNSENLISEIFPALQTDQFIIQKHMQSATSGFLCVIRKQALQTILNYLLTHKFAVADLIIGPCFLNAVPLITANYNSVTSSAYVIEFSENSIASVTTNTNTNNTYSIDDFEITSAQLLSFSAAFIYLVQFSHFENYNNEYNFKTKHAENNKFNILAYAFIFIFFVLCSINFLFYSSLFKNNNKTNAALTLYQGKFDQVSKVFDEYEKKRTLIEQTGILNSNLIAKQADHIAQTLPQEIVLNDWQFNPLIKQANDDSLIAFSKNSIIIKGNCNKSIVINEWVNLLKRLTFIEDVTLQKFSFSKDAHISNFELIIHTN